MMMSSGRPHELIAWRPRRSSAAIGLLAGLFIGFGSITTPNTGDHPSCGDGPLIASTVLQIVSFFINIGAGAIATLMPPGDSGTGRRPRSRLDHRA
ncbi:hypothetical protein [Streptomyces zagrosensis]|uniref:Uncharacterized protein n=1 Tax=Streptomyces zagrosensis TaxID=1042984 RepID=A0A7W9Q917_9ACTN|nr:hypothetical protein [Streptomyces zagrosensis]MBB5934747.1 hypothetical protein [Streptomyces zagrosensis]